MKTVYTVEYSDYGDNEVYGSFEDPLLAQKLCDEVNEYFKTQGLEKTAIFWEMKIFNESDPMYRYRVYLSIEDKNDIHVEKIAPTYQPIMLNWLTTEMVKDSIQNNMVIKTIVKYGVTQEQAIKEAIDFYNELNEQNLIEPLLNIIKQKDKAHSY